jgi:predicted SnoaL-like aldol condensation-catalyzing enzyme
MKKNQLILILIIAPVLLVTGCKNKSMDDTAIQSELDSLQEQFLKLSETIQKDADNKEIVADFYQKLFGDKNLEAVDEYIGDVYIQHNPALPDGKEALKDWLKERFKDAPKEKVDIQHLGADGDFVYIHTRAKFNDGVYSIIDIFRIENGKIVEHWDVIQKVPEVSANPHPMF